MGGSPNLDFLDQTFGRTHRVSICSQPMAMFIGQWSKLHKSFSYIVHGTILKEWQVLVWREEGATMLTSCANSPLFLPVISSAYTPANCSLSLSNSKTYEDVSLRMTRVLHSCTKTHIYLLKGSWLLMRKIASSRSSEINAFDISIAPGKDCSTCLTPQHCRGELLRGEGRGSP